MSRSKKPKSKAPAPRAGLSAAFPTVTRGDSTGVQVDLRTLPQPELLGHASLCKASAGPHGLDIIFGVDGYPDPLSRILIPFGPFYGAIISNIEEFHRLSLEWEAAKGWTHTACEPITTAPGCPAFPVHILRIGRVGRETELECFYISVGSASRATVTPGGKIIVSPIARLHMPLQILMGLLDLIRKHAGQGDD